MTPTFETESGSMLDLQKLRELLTGIARAEATVPYQGVIKALDIPAPAMQTLTQGLEILQWQDALLDRPPLAAVVVQKKQPCPRPGFFQTAQELAVYEGPAEGVEAQMWHQHQLERVWQHAAP